MNSHLPCINMFWDGPCLGEIHTACIRSFLRIGHHVVLHCYAPPGDLPDGVEIFDAKQIMPRSDLLVHRATGSVSLGSNRYRYRLIAAGMGIYADCDMYCLQPIFDMDYIFGWEDAHFINGALLKYPSHSELAQMLVDETQTKNYMTFSMGRGIKFPMDFRPTTDASLSISDAPWGVWGPKLLTRCILNLKLEHKAQPIDIFYPFHHRCTSLLFEPGLRIEDLATPRTQAIHLWHQAQDRRDPPAGSPLRQIIEMP